MYRQLLNHPRIPRRTAPSQLGDLFFLPIFNPIPESIFPGYFFIRAGEERGAVPARKDKDHLTVPAAGVLFSLLVFHSPFHFQKRGFFLPV